jgi:hypothetical protein
MRRFFLVLLMVLVPLRVWAAEGMTVKMAGMQLGAAATVANVQMKTGMPLDCPMMATQADGIQDGQPQGESQSHAGCQSCQLCMAMAAPQIFDLVAPEMIKSGLRIWHPSFYTSADIARDVKPPIS